VRSTDDGSQAAPEPPDRLVASPRHTLILIGIVLGITALSAARRTILVTGDGGSRAPAYALLIFAEWLLFGYAMRGLRRAGTPTADIIGRRWGSAGGVMRLLAWGAGFALVSGAALAAVKSAMAALDWTIVGETRRTTAMMAPHGGLESAVWVALSLSAGFCEEFVFRGYLQRQMIALTRSRAGGIAAAALLFGASHLYQGLRSALVIAVYGLMFGVLARLSRSLLPGMLAHAAQDLLAGLLHR
jgi:hypothetical protein